MNRSCDNKCITRQGYQIEILKERERCQMWLSCDNKMYHKSLLCYQIKTLQRFQDNWYRSVLKLIQLF